MNSGEIRYSIEQHEFRINRRSHLSGIQHAHFLSAAGSLTEQVRDSPAFAETPVIRMESPVAKRGRARICGESDTARTSIRTSGPPPILWCWNRGGTTVGVALRSVLHRTKGTAH